MITFLPVGNLKDSAKQRGNYIPFPSTVYRLPFTAYRILSSVYRLPSTDFLVIPSVSEESLNSCSV